MLYLPNLENISTFVIVVQTGSFTKAAKALGISTNATSRRVMDLESELGVRLLTRTTRSIAMTDEGQTLFNLAERSINDLVTARAVLRNRSEFVKGRVRVACPSVFVTSGLFTAFQDLQKKHPDLIVQLVVLDSAPENFREIVDISIEPGPLKNSDRIAKSLGHLTWKFAASEDYVRRHGSPRSPSELSKHLCLPVVNVRRQKTWTLKGNNGKLVDVELNNLFEANDSRVLKEALYKGLGIGILSPGELARGIKYHSLVPILPEYTFAEANEAFILYPKNSDKIPRNRILMEILIGNFNKEILE